MRYTNDILLPHKLLHGAGAIHKQSSILVPHTLQSRALKDHVAFVPNCTLITQQTQALGPRGASAASLNHWEAVGTHPEAQQDTHAMSTKRLHQQGPRPAQVLRPSKLPVSMYTTWHGPTGTQSRWHANLGGDDVNITWVRGACLICSPFVASKQTPIDLDVSNCRLVQAWPFFAPFGSHGDADGLCNGLLYQPSQVTSLPCGWVSL